MHGASLFFQRIAAVAAYSGRRRSAGRVAAKLAIEAACVCSVPCRERNVAAPRDPERYASAHKSTTAISDMVSRGSSTLPPLTARGSAVADAYRNNFD